MSEAKTEDKPDDWSPIKDDEFQTKTWKDYDVVESKTGEYLFKDKIWKRNLETGEWRAIPIRFKVLREPDERAARAEAREIAEADKLDAKIDTDRFDDLDTVCILARVLHDATEPYNRFAIDARDLEKRLDKPQMEQAFKKTEHFRYLIDPQPADLTPQEVATISAAIVEERSIRPLLVCGGPSQVHWALITAETHVASLVDKFLTESSSPSTAES